MSAWDLYDTWLEERLRRFEYEVNSMFAEFAGKLTVEQELLFFKHRNEQESKS